ncbi:MAG TPA: tetratricopeptide repeat protein [Cryomorphaceae bacterium]|jgi:tetratricopeptide (TPR) repeat protein|nr:MAG: hypothetical protein ABR98_05070 [Cryomorphaceae bacterium BACL7 MAG-120910-bin2]KRO68314.1 MAG: hypothetical protein ABR88_03585 [Cryomorphaceae bacterium BACL7 MAG-120322-bin74]KRO83973.1 MAG: hypothetical protein ABR87_05605 [Cryomorphaceae bacterium BACL7 MAG-121220-bin83]HAB32086.1 tetratricopeptide repeat protein [Cryomorphaceae bacterium]|tara:strand:- start:1446 stop:2144 length:699 start_codon:yes stop_codon:yes gene_type:complete
MAKKKEFDLIENPGAVVEASIGKVESFVNTHKQRITQVLGGAIAVFALFWAYNFFIAAPAEKEAQIALYPAQKAFAQDSLKLALNGNADQLGFLDILDEHGSTKAGNLSEYYAGLCYLGLGQSEEAIAHLDAFSSHDGVLSAVAIGAIGDAFADLNQPEEAQEYYSKASKEEANNFLTPFFLSKAGSAAEMNSDYKAALKFYKRIKADFPTSSEAADIDALIAYSEAKLNNK